MPELPEVETTKASLAPLLNQRISDIYLSGKRLREPIAHDLAQLIGYRLVAVERRAKYLLLDFHGDSKADKQGADNQKADKQLLIHLGMSGSLGQSANAQYRKHDHVIFSFDDRHLHYHDPRRFGMVMWTTDAHRYLAKLGIEPLGDAFTGRYLYDFIHKNPNRPKRAPIKAVIMEQACVVGVGNIYATESLFLSRIHPAYPAHLLGLDKLDELVSHIKAILQQAIAQGGSSLKDFRVGDNQTGYFQQTLLAYGRAGQPCPTCHLVLENTKITGRASVFCPSCQPIADPS